jgi:hypothetical protein
MIRRADVPIQLACGGFLTTALVIDWLSIQVMPSSRMALSVLLPIVLPCLLGLLGALLTSRVVSRSLRRVALTALAASSLLGAGAAAALFVLVRLRGIRLDDALAHGAGIGAVFGVFAVLLWLRAGQAHTGGRRAGWAVVALLLAAPQPLLVIASKNLPSNTSFDLSAALGLLGCAVLVSIAIADLRSVQSAKQRLLGATSDLATSEADIKRADRDVVISLALAVVGCCLVFVAFAVADAGYSLIR